MFWKYCFCFQHKSHLAATLKFPKPKDEGWFIVLGDTSDNELIAMKRLPYIRGRKSTSLAFFTPMEPCKCVYTLYFMSDSYLGLDQQFDIHLDVVEASELSIDEEDDYQEREL